MSAANLLRQGQKLLARELPAIIQIDNQWYEAATNGLHRGMELGDGIGELQRKVCFWLPVQNFFAAGARIPRERSPVIYDNVEYEIESVFVDPEKVNCTLNCIQRPQ